jgi:catechol 2,3-dioxygenase-like lactoylglutathione lyase family enzyme
MSITSVLTLVVLRCGDLERARSFYEALGLALRSEQHGKGPVHYSATLGHTVLELYPDGGATTRGVRLGLRVTNLAETLAAAKQSGAQIVSVNESSQPPHAVIEDLDGHRIELVEEYPTSTCLLDLSAVSDWDTFHDLFAKKFGFPQFYGRNMNAWIDCMSCLDVPEDGLSTVHVQRGDVLTLEITGANELLARCPEIHQALIDCAAFVNWRRRERGDPSLLALSWRPSAGRAPTAG